MKPTDYILHSRCAMISDLHLGSPLDDRLEDFDQDEAFEQLLLKTLPEAVEQQPLTLVIAGDFIDFPQVLPTLSRHSWGDRYGTTEDESHLRMQRVLDGHPCVFSALREFIARGGQVLVLPGNHDIDLVWDKVFNAFKQAVGAREPQVCLVKEGFLFEQQIYIEHGNQYSFENKFTKWPRPILPAPDQRLRLERAWGTLFLDLIYNDIEDLYPFVNKIYPTSDLIPLLIRSIGKYNAVSPKVLARFLIFLLLKGKRTIKEYLLGNQALMSDPLSAADAFSQERIFSAILEYNDRIPATQAAEVADEIMVLLKDPDSLPGTISKLDYFDGVKGSARPGLSPNDGEADDGISVLDGLLGKTNEAGLQARQFDLLTSGEIKIVAFGHTHEPVDGNEECIFGNTDSRRAFNTGSWMPRLPSQALENLTWSDLKEKWPEFKAKILVRDIRYLLIELGSAPHGQLVKYL